MRWQAILAGVLAGAATGAAAEAPDCVGIEMATYGDPGEVRCLPWVDWGTPRIETIPSRVSESITVFDASEIQMLGVYDISDLTRIDPWYDIPELDQGGGRAAQGSSSSAQVRPLRSWMMRRCRSFGLVVLLGVAAACGGGGGGGGGVVTVPALDFDPALGSRAFSNPVKLVQHPTDDNRWYVVEQDGLVKTFLATNSTTATVAADVGALVNFGSNTEQGLLGMAFDPNFATSGEVYFTFTDETTDDVVLERWKSSDNGLTFTRIEIVLSIPHDLGNHNGSDIMFGPDGFLYFSMGDGGGADDPDDNGQDPNVLLGKILRIDVNSTPPVGEAYAIPPTNPFAANAHCDAGPGSAPCPEIFALGFRNPWRMNFDPMNGRLYAGDVGQGAQEEIDLVVVGANYGWDCLEGEAAHTTSALCNFPSFTAPEVVHGRSEAQAITGGAVYRGASIPGLVGFYVYGDFQTGRFFAFDTSVAHAPAQNLALPVTNVSAFGQGRDGEIYVVGFGTPSIQKLVPGSG